MKKVFFLVVVTAVSMFYSCETESVEVIEGKVEVLETPTKLSSANYLCFYRPIMGTNFKNRMSCFPNANGTDICGFEKECIFTGVFDSGDFCILQPCRPDLSFPSGFPDIIDPWKVADLINPIDILSIKDNLKLNLKSHETVMHFALNKSIAGLQFYEAESLFKDNSYLVRNTLDLDAKISKNLGLQGNVVKAGRYPVVVNPKNGTYNVLLAVEKGFK